MNENQFKELIERETEALMADIVATVYPKGPSLLQAAAERRKRERATWGRLR